MNIASKRSLVVSGGEDDVAYVWRVPDGDTVFTCTGRSTSTLFGSLITTSTVSRSLITTTTVCRSLITTSTVFGSLVTIGRLCVVQSSNHLCCQYMHRLGGNCFSFLKFVGTMMAD